MAEMNTRAARYAEGKSTTLHDAKAQPHAIRTDVAALTETARTFVKEQSHVFRASAGAAADGAMTKARKTRKELIHQVEQAEKVLDHRAQEHPLQSILRAFELGILVFLLLRR